MTGTSGSHTVPLESSPPGKLRHPRMRSFSHQPIQFLENPRGHGKAPRGEARFGIKQTTLEGRGGGGWSKKSAAWKSGCIHTQENSAEGKASCKLHPGPSTTHLCPGRLTPTLCDFKQASHPTGGISTPACTMPLTDRHKPK